MRRRKAAAHDFRLADLVPEVRADYAAFLRMGRAEEEDAKTFGARHAAAKTALAHLEHLMKVAGGGEDAEDTEPAEGLLSDIRRRMHQEEQETPEDDQPEPG